MNHMGLVAAVEQTIKHRIPILNCARCSAFWFSLIYGATGIRYDVVTDYLLVVAVSFLTAYAAVWTELLLGGIDLLYNRIYDTFYPAAAGSSGDPAAPTTDTPPADTHDSDDVVPDVREVN